MADTTKKTTEKPTPAVPAAPRLAPAGASGDAGVQWLLAERHAHTSNGDAERVADIDRQLAELGYTAQ